MRRFLAVAWAIMAIALSAIPAKSDISLSPIVNPRPLVSGNSLVATGPNSLSSSGATYYASAWGVKCDGVTDTTSAIQVAETAINAAGGGTLVFPAGTCMVSNVGVAKLSNVYWQGQGVGQTIIKMEAGSYTTSHAAVYATSATDFGVSDMTFDYSLATTTGNNTVFGVQGGTNWYFRNNSIIGVKVFGLGVSLGSNFDVSGNYCNKPSATGAFDNECFLFSTAAGQNSECSLRNNTAIGSGIDVSGLCDIVGNYVTGWGFGSGITVELDSNTHNVLVADNQSGVSLTAADVNGYYITGIENWAPNSIIRNNRLWSNCGNGIDNGGPKTIVQGNYAWDNGTCAAGGPAQNGFVTRYTNGSVNGNGSVYTSNYAWDDGAGTQLYGYRDASASVSVFMSGNQFSGVTAAISVSGAAIASEAAGAFTVDASGFVHPANLNFTKAVNFGAGPGTDNSGNNSWIQSAGLTATGVCSNTIICYLNQMVVNDTVDASAAVNGLDFVFLNDTATNGAKGSRHGLWVETNQLAGTTPANGPFLSAITAQGEADANAVSGSAANWSMVQYAIMKGSGYLSNIGTELDQACTSTCTVQFSDGIEIVLNSNNETAASVENNGFMVTAQSGATPTITTAYAINGYQGVNPMASTGYLMRWLPNGAAWTSGAVGPTITGGIDLINFTFTGNAFRSTGFSVDGSGNVISPSYQTSAALITAVNGGNTAAFTANMVGSTGGPTTAAQNGWVKMKDSSGATIWIPEWK